MDSVKFIRCYKDAVMDFLPNLLREYNGLYGISFELAGVEQDVYYDKDRYNCFAYVCTEDMYREKTDEDTDWYYRFGVWGEWEPVRADTPLFEKVKEFLLQSVKPDEDGEIPEEETDEIRVLQAKAIGELRAEVFFEGIGCPDIYIVPFEAEGADKELHAKLFKEMDGGVHGKEYLEHLDDFL